MRIFVSYRREDSSAWAGRLRDGLADRFGDENVFLDVDTVGPGENFTDAIDQALDASDAVFVVIGPDWLTPEGSDGTPRLANAGDYVRYEVSAALARHSRVVPVLVGGAAMPRRDLLPDDVRGLADRQAVTLHDATWRPDVNALVARLDRDEPSPRRVGWQGLTTVFIAVLAVAVAAVLLLLIPNGSNPDDAAETSVTATREQEPETETQAQDEATTADAPTTTALVESMAVTTIATTTTSEPEPAPVTTEPPAVVLARQYSAALADGDWNTVRYLLGSDREDDYWQSNYQYLELQEIVDYEIRGRVDNAVILRVLVVANESVPDEPRTSWYCFEYLVDVTIPDIDSVDRLDIDRYPGFTDDWSIVPSHYMTTCAAAEFE